MQLEGMQPMFYRNAVNFATTLCVSLILSVVLIGCGEEPAAQPTIEEQMVGYWFGNMQIDLGVGEPWNYYSAIYVDATTESLTLDGICTDGSSQITAKRSAMTASWSGALVCMWKTSQCPDGVVKYTSASIKFGPDAIDLVLTGQAIACGEQFTVRTIGTLHR